MKTVLVVGYNTRHICQSAKRAGFRVYTIEHYGDRDLREVTDKVMLFREPVEPDEISELLTCFEDYDLIVCGPGFETWRPETTTPVLNNDPGLIRQVSDKYWLSEYLQEKGIRHPDTWLLQDVNAEEMTYPLMLKPRWGAGGIENRLLISHTQLKEAQQTCEDFILQEYLPGKTTSVTLIATGDGRACSIATNEQLQGITPPGMPYAYQGNITPYAGRHVKRMRELAEHIAADLRLTGSNGVDFLLTPRGLLVLEVNPRFQGTLETVERAYGVNLFHMHINAFKGVLPEPVEAKRFAAKTVLFAKKNTRVNTHLSDLLYTCHKKSQACDVPHPGVLIPENKPVVTLFSTGTTRKQTLVRLKTLSNRIHSEIEHLCV